MDALAAIAVSAVFVPPLPSTTTITGKQIDVGQGWPLAEDIDAAVKAGTSIVSIYAVPGSGGNPPQVFDFDPGTIVQPVHGLSASVSDIEATITGTSNAGETVALVVDGNARGGGFFYSHSSHAPETGSVVAVALLVGVQMNYPQASVSGEVLTITGAHLVEALVGSTATVGQKIHRQTVQFRIVTWAANPADRTAIGRAIDVAMKNALRIQMPDTSQAIITCQGTNLSDHEENEGVYRRDLMMTALFDTILEYQATEVLGTQINFVPEPNTP